jgi:hypothetical protein
VVTRYDDVLEIFNRPDTFASDRFRKIDERYASRRPAVTRGRGRARALARLSRCAGPRSHARAAPAVVHAEAARVQP